MRNSAMWLCLLCGISATSACSYQGVPANQDPTTDVRQAAHEMAAARCDRQTPACLTASSAHYENRQACIEAKVAPSVTEAHLVDCGYYSLNERSLRSCVRKIREGQCGTGIAQLDDCRGAKVCPYASEEGSARNDSPPPARTLSLAATVPNL